MDGTQPSWFASHWKGVVGSVLSLVPVAWLVRWVMRETYPVSKLSGRIVVDGCTTGSIYINKHRKAICGITLHVRHFWCFAIEFEPMRFEPCFFGYGSFCQIDADVNPSKVRSGQTAQIAIPDYELTSEKVSWMDTTFHNPGWVDLGYMGKLKFKTWFGSFEHPISPLVRCNVLRD
jgi:hypothetical protein